MEEQGWMTENELWRTDDRGWSTTDGRLRMDHPRIDRGQRMENAFRSERVT